MIFLSDPNICYTTIVRVASWLAYVLVNPALVQCLTPQRRIVHCSGAIHLSSSYCVDFDQSTE